MPRFVILRHEPPPSGGRPLHWDFMLQDGESLLTWALEHEPIFDVPIPAERLANHRLEYLDYEGPVSKNRGTVTRWDAGEFDWRLLTEAEFVVEIRQGSVRGRACLVRLPADTQRWVVSFSAA